MKRLFERGVLICLLLVLCILSLHSQNRIQYTYDKSGNRIERIIELNTSKTKIISDTIPPITEIRNSFTFKIYPNPTNGQLSVEFDFGELYKYMPSDFIKIYDRNGVLIKTKKIAEDRIYIDISNQPIGIYMMNISIKNESISWKIIKN